MRPSRQRGSSSRTAKPITSFPPLGTPCSEAHSVAEFVLA
jgi:hypothetical protein